MRVGCLISGGKDGLYASYLASKKNKLVCIISLRAKEGSYMFHVPNVELVEKQSEVMNLPLITMETEGKKEEELEYLKEAIKIAVKKYKIEGLVSGALASNYQKTRIDKICKELGIESISPMWQKDPKEYMHELLLDKFKVVIVGVYADGLDKSWLGRIIDSKCIKDLEKMREKYKIHLGFEGGEMESFVMDCPLFKKKINILDSEKIMDSKCSGYLKIKKIELVEKN